MSQGMFFCKMKRTNIEIERLSPMLYLYLVRTGKVIFIKCCYLMKKICFHYTYILYKYSHYYAFGFEKCKTFMAFKKQKHIPSASYIILQEFDWK